MVLPFVINWNKMTLCWIGIGLLIESWIQLCFWLCLWILRIEVRSTHKAAWPDLTTASFTTLSIWSTWFHIGEQLQFPSRTPALRKQKPSGRLRYHRHISWTAQERSAPPPPPPLVGLINRVVLAASLTQTDISRLPLAGTCLFSLRRPWPPQTALLNGKKHEIYIKLFQI